MIQTTINMLFQLLFLVSYAMAAPIEAQTHGNALAYGSGGGVVGLIVLVLDIIIFIEVLKSNRPVSHKLGWSLLVLLFPLLGLIIYWLFSNRDAHTGSGSYEAIP